VPGGADRSYGVHVAELAGLPRAVVQRAREVLGQLENGIQGNGHRGPERTAQLPLLPAPADDRLRRDLARMDVDSMTPLEAVTALYELRKRALAEGAGDAR
jgi:DNA mismatch repair protein MutS